MKNLIKTTLAAVAFVACGLPAQAAERTLVISSWAPPGHGINAIFWPKFIEEVEATTDGRISAEIKYGLSSPPAQYDLVLDGAADVSWIFHGYSPGKFTATKLIELPGYSGNAEAASVAYWKAHEKFLAQANEHRDVKLAALMTHGPGILHSIEPVKTLDEIAGMKLRLGGGVSGDVGAALGATGIRVPAPKVYETLASNAADGVMMPMEGKAGFKLTEVARHTLTVPGGFYRGSFAVIMNQDTFDDISEADRQALESLFGEKLSRIAGQVWDSIDAIGEEALLSAGDNTLTEASADDIEKWKALTGPIVENVLSEVSARGIDAAAARSYIAEQMSQ